MVEPSWSLHLLSELLSAFNVEDPDALRNVIHRVGEAVDAEVVAVLAPDLWIDGIGVGPEDTVQLQAACRRRPQQLELSSGTLYCQWSPLQGSEWLVTGRLAQPFDLEERSLLRAMARSIALSLQVLRSVAAERLARQEAEQQATHDSLTGLPNRAQVITHLAKLLKSAKESEAKTCFVFFIDLDRFKIINDAHGHGVGDHLLIAIAARLRCLIGADLVGRLGGDEFLVITQQTDHQSAERLAQHVISALLEPVSVLGKSLCSGASLGIAVFAPGETAERLIENADMAMYRAKQLGRGRYCFYDVAMRRDGQRRANLEADLHRALANGEIECHLQPIMRLEPEPKLVGFEALARWRHPEHGYLQPLDFIPLAEESGLIIEIDYHLLSMSCSLMASWIQQGHDDLHLSVNVSGRSFQDPHLVNRVERVLSATGMPVHRLYLEITETVPPSSPWLVSTPLDCDWPSMISAQATPLCAICAVSRSRF
jgi:diguanylate cyclase (GGDEF)-like protein